MKTIHNKENYNPKDNNSILDYIYLLCEESDMSNEERLSDIEEVISKWRAQQYWNTKTKEEKNAND